MREYIAFENMLLVKKIGIIGCKGKVGTKLASDFKSLGYEVLGSDIDTTTNSRKVGEQSDIIFYAGLPHTIGKTIQEIRDVIGRKPLVILCSVMEKPVELASEFNVLGAHFLCDPNDLAPGQTIIYSDAKSEVRNFLHNNIFPSFTEFTLSPREHDEYMALIQSVQHLNTVAMVAAMAKVGIDWQRYVTRSNDEFQLTMLFAQRILGQSAHMYGNIVKGSQAAQKLNTRLLENYRATESRQSLASAKEAFSGYRRYPAIHIHQLIKQARSHGISSSLGADSALPSFIQTESAIALAQTIISSGKIDLLTSLSSPIYLIELHKVCSILHKKGILLSDLEDDEASLAKDYQEARNRIIQEINKGDIDTFVQYFQKAKQYFGKETCQAAQKITSSIIDTEITALRNAD